MTRSRIQSTLLAVIAVFSATGAFHAVAAEKNDAPAWFQDGRLMIVSSSHQDTGWMDTVDFCRKFRVEQVLLPAMKMMRKDPNYTFCMECSLHLMELLDAHPELRGEIIERMKEGRLEFGATYNQPYESWLSGEELVRQTYFGRRWIKTNLPGCDAKVAFNADPPGRSLQMQQILSKAGIPYMFFSRYHEGLYRWLSPDGSGVLMYTPGHYINHWSFLKGAPADACNAIRGKLEQQGPYYQQRNIPPVYCLINSVDLSEPVSFRPLIDMWNSQPQAGNGVKWPKMEYSSIRGFFSAIDKPQAKFDTRLGERPDVWAYITGPTHHELASLRREAARLLPAAETFSTVACLLKDSFQNYPRHELNEAWMNEIYTDHGIGGKNGHITDEVFRSKVENARDTGRRLLDKAQQGIAAAVQTNTNKGTPIVVFNSLSWKRSDIVEVDLPEGVAGAVHVVDAGGNEVPSQTTLLDSPDEWNVAASAAGAKATASSTFGPDYEAAKAINGRWAVRDPDATLGSSDKWNSAAKSTGPHWLVIDFGQPRTIHKVAVRHEGCIGVFQAESGFNTADFQIQGADDAAGPWTDLVRPIVGNADSLTVHTFSPKTVRFLRLFITKGTQPGSDQMARIYEVEAFAKTVANARKLLFVANDVPSLGYKTFYLAAGPGSLSAKPPVVSDAACENSFYRVALSPGGIKSIHDKQLDRELLKTDKFLGGEVFTMLSVAPDNRGRGTDAGEFGVMPMPVMDETFDRVANHKPAWRLLENGPVRTVYGLDQPLADTTVRQRVVVWHPIRRVDCEVDLADFNGRLWREFRMALPVADDKPTVAYEVPMGVVEIGKGEVPTTGGHSYGDVVYSDQCRDIGPREVQNFVDASGSSGGLTMSSSVSVFDWKDPTNHPAASPVLQPILLASRKSCNGEGNWYPQAGDHHYRFSLTSHDGGWRNGWQPAIAANHPLQPVLDPRRHEDARLPESLSFLQVSTPNIVVSAVKKCEDDDSLVVRCYDIEGTNRRPTFTLFSPLLSAEHTNLIEEEGKPMAVVDKTFSLDVGHHAIETVKLKLKSGPVLP
jgi:hypothetical protein